MQVVLGPKGEGDGRIEVVQCQTLRSPFHVPGTPIWEGHRVELGEVGVGEYHATASTFRSEKENTPEMNSWNSVEIGSQFDGDIKIEDGKPTVIEIP